MNRTETIYAIGYARVSTAKQAVEGESLELQAGRIARSIESCGWRLFPGTVFQEPFTGTTDDRPIYKEALRLIRSNPGKVKYFVVNSIDRFSREGSYRYQQMKMELARTGVQLRDIGGVIQPAVNSLAHLGFKYPWSVWSASDVGEVAIAESNNQERSRILSRLIEAQIKLTQDGYHLGIANDGYVSKRIFVDGKKKFALFPDPDRALFVRTMFAMRAEGTASDIDIVRHLNGMGFRKKVFKKWNKAKTAIVGEQLPKPLTVKHFQQLVQNPVYCGVVARKWTHGNAIRTRGGEPLVSIATFNAANRGKVFVDELEDESVQLLYDYSPTKQARKRSKFSQRWSFKNVVACPHCRRFLWASASRGRSGKYFAAYHCARGHRRYSVPQQTLDEAFFTFLESLQFESRFLTAFDAVLTAMFEEARSIWRDESAERDSKIKLAEARQIQLVNAFTDASSSSVRQILERQIADLDAAIAELQRNAQTFGLAEDTVARFLARAREVLEHPRIILENIGNVREQAALYDLFFERPPTYEQIVSGTPELRPTFALVRRLQDSNAGVVDTTSFNWNLIQEDLERWQNAASVIDAVLERVKANLEHNEAS